MNKLLIWLFELSFLSNIVINQVSAHKYLLTGEPYSDEASIVDQQTLKEDSHTPLEPFLDFIFDDFKIGGKPDSIIIGDTIFVGNRLRNSFKFMIVELNYSHQAEIIPKLTKGCNFTGYQEYVVMEYASHRTKNIEDAHPYSETGPISMELFGVACPATFTQMPEGAVVLISYDMFREDGWKFEAIIELSSIKNGKYPPGYYAGDVIESAIELIPKEEIPKNHEKLSPFSTVPVAISNSITIKNMAKTKKYKWTLRILSKFLYNQDIPIGKKRISFPKNTPGKIVAFNELSAGKQWSYQIPQEMRQNHRNIDYQYYGLFKQTKALGIHFEVFVRKLKYIGMRFETLT